MDNAIDNGESTGAPFTLVMPHVLYQSASIDVCLAEERLIGCTVLWLAFPEELSFGARFALHCRATVTDVLVNNKPAPFDQRDPLSRLDPHRTQHNFSCVELDAHFRGALELSNEGELRIVIPTDSKSQSLPSLQPLPDNAPTDVVQAFRRLEALRVALGPDRLQSQGSQPPSELLMQVEVEDGPGSETAGGFRQLLQVQIFYELQCGEMKSSRSFGGGGVTFRRSAEDESALEQDRLRTELGSMRRAAISEPTCAYTLGPGAGGSLRDPDGVRFWLPCLDVLDQRCIFDLSFIAPSSCCVISSGKRVSVMPALSAGINSARASTFAVPTNVSSRVTVMATRQCSRFVSAVRLPAAALGFFVGRCETYRMGLYRTNSRVWVATGLADTIGGGGSRNIDYRNSALASDAPTSAATSGGGQVPLRVPTLQQAKMNQAPGVRARSGSASSVDSASDTMSEDGPEPSSKRARRGSFDGRRSRSNSVPEALKPVAQSTPKVALNAVTGASERLRPRSSSLGGESVEKSASWRAFSVPVGRASQPTRTEQSMRTSDDGAQPLYEVLVRHTTLGLDLATRLLHKFSGHLYTNSVYTQGRSNFSPSSLPHIRTP